MKLLPFALLALSLPACSGSQQEGTTATAAGWPLAGYTLGNNRYVSSKLDATNVAKLAPAWTTQLADIGEQEAAPIVDGTGTMYVSTPHDHVLALDAATGKLKWDAPYTPAEVLDFAVNRGVGLSNGKIFIATQDCKVRALDASTGKQLWSVAGCSTQANNWYSMAVYPYKDMLLVGVAGGDFGGNGSVQAFDAADGKKLWQWNTIPGPGEPGHETWPGDSWKHGGAALWGGLSVDPATSTLYIAPGNASPDFSDVDRKGKNLYSDSVVALDISGPQPKMKWYYQILNPDAHDADPAMPPVLFDAKTSGRHLLAIADKAGNFVVLDRTTGALLHRTAVSDQQGLAVTPSPKGDKACPNHGGGVEWNGGAYDQQTNYFIVPSTQECGEFRSFAAQPPWKQGQNYRGGPPTKRQDGTGIITAVDMDSGTIAWHVLVPYPAEGGTLITTSGIAFTSDLAGNLYALDTKTGKQLWKYATQTSIVAPFSLYDAGGAEYLAVLGGDPGNQKTPNVPSSKGSYVMAFGIGAASPVANGTEGQSAAAATAVAAGTTQAGSAPYTLAQARAGKAAYATSCATCHGAQLQGISAPALTGAAFGAGHLSISGLRSVVTKQMPLTAPGSLSAGAYASIMAFLLASNCVTPEGTAPFPPADDPAFKSVILAGKTCPVK